MGLDEMAFDLSFFETLVLGARSQIRSKNADIRLDDARRSIPNPRHLVLIFYASIGFFP